MKVLPQPPVDIFTAGTVAASVYGFRGLSSSRRMGDPS